MVAIQPKQEDHEGESCLHHQFGDHRDEMIMKRLLAVVYVASIPALFFGFYLAMAYEKVNAAEEDKKAPQAYIWELGMLYLGYGATMCGVMSLVGPFEKQEPLVTLIFCDLLFLVVLPFMGLCPASYSDDVPQVVGLMCLSFAGAIVLIHLTCYISEIAPSTKRGALVSVVFLQIAAGKILYHLLNWISSCPTQGTQTWRWLIPIIILIIHIVCAAGVLPESPWWLYREGHIQQAEESLKMLRSSCDISKEVTAMELSLLDEVDVSEIQEEDKLRFLNVIWLHMVSGRRIIIGLGSLLAQQFVGLSIIMRYSYSVFHLTTNRYNNKIVNGNADNIVSSVSSSEIPLITSSLVLVGTLICTILVDRFGRRRLLLVSITGITASLGILSILFCTGSTSVVGIIDPLSNTNENRDFWYNIDEERTSCMGLVALLALAMYIIFHSLGVGTVPWIINSEIYPMKYRTVCLGVANAVYWCSNMVVQDLFFDRLGNHFSVAQMLFMLCLFSAIVGIFIYLYIPETKRLRLEEIGKVLLQQEKCIEMDDYII